jgi:hypothetical protein
MNMKKIKYIFVVMMLVAGTFFTMQVVAHSPSYMKLEYNLNTQNLKVTIIHDVYDRDSHYINKVEIEKNSVLYDRSFIRVNQLRIRSLITIQLKQKLVMS